MIRTAIILAAGRGERMRPLTDHLPKPLLEAGGKPLIVWHLERLAKCGISQVVVNHAWLGEKIEQRLGNGAHWGLKIMYSPEGVALETAGGIAKALPLLGSTPFLTISGDIFCDFDFARAHTIAAQLIHTRAHCVMVPNAAHHPLGDFAVDNGQLVRPSSSKGLPGLTFSGIAVYQPDFFANVPLGQKTALRPLLEAGVDEQQISAEVHAGTWLDIGTPERLQSLNTALIESEALDGRISGRAS